MHFRILGPLEALAEGETVTLGGSKQRALLAVLLLHANETLSSERLIDELWGEQPPVTALKTVQVHVSRLRKTLAGGAVGAADDAMIVTRDHGYELRLDPGHLDAHEFEALMAEGSRELAAERPEPAATALEAALSLWRGTALADLAHEPFARRAIGRLEERRVTAVEQLIDAKLALGAHAEVVNPLETLIGEHPYRERLHAQLMLALYRCERQADALQTYQNARRILVDALGIEPGERLRELERAILAQDSALALGALESSPEPHAGRRFAALIGHERGRGDDGGTSRSPPALVIERKHRLDRPERPPGAAGAGRHRPPPLRDGTASLVGRREELAAVDEELARARAGVRLVVIEGEAGIGKTTVWRAAIARAGAQGYRVLSCRAAHAETRLSFACLGDLVGPVDEAALALLPAPQRRALEVALLRAEADGAALDPRAIGSGLVSLLSGLAADAPVLLALDDVQWLDRPTARALEFAVRRLDDRPLAVVATLRPGGRRGAPGPLCVVPADRTRRVHLGPLGLDALYDILRDRLGGGLTRPLLGRIERASRGNPFYALELARALEAAGPAAPADALPVPESVGDLVAARLSRLPARTRDELLKASALARPTTALVDADALGPAEEAGVVLVDADGRVEFRHPLFAGALYEGASRARRRRLHGELAEIVTDVEERARHLVRATEDRSERVAAVLDEASRHADGRGAPEVAAEFSEQAAQRTPEDSADARWERSLCAGRLHFRAGDASRARALAHAVTAEAPPPRVRARALHLLAEVSTPAGPRASLPILEEALACAGDDALLAAPLEFGVALSLMIVSEHARALEHLDRAVALAESSGETGLLAQATGLREAARLSAGRGVDDEALERALSLEHPDRDVSFQLRPSVTVAVAYLFSGRVAPARRLLAAAHERIVARGEEGELPFVLIYLGIAATLSGELERGAVISGEAMRAAALTGQDMLGAFAGAERAIARAWSGDTAGARSDATKALAVSEGVGWRDGIFQSRWALGFLAVSEGDARGAATALEPVVALVEAEGVYEFPSACMVPDAVEAYVATGDLARAARLADALSEWGRRFDRPWALAVGGRCRALERAAAGDLDSAEDAGKRGLVEHERLSMPLELARTLLVTGQVQRRRGHRRAAGECVQQALSTFERLGAPLWAATARAEARRIGARRGDP